MSNAFEAFADAAKSPKARAYEAKKAKAPMTMSERVQKERHAEACATPVQKAEIERRKLQRSYRQFKAGQLRDLLAGPHGRNIVGLRKFMRRLTIGDAPALVAHVESCAWIWELELERRLLVRALIDARIVRIRQLAGFHPFDDPLPASMSEGGEEEPSASIIILEMLAA